MRMTRGRKKRGNNELEGRRSGRQRIGKKATITRKLWKKKCKRK